MAFDGIVTKAVAVELKKLVGYKIDKIYQPNKNTIVLGLYGPLGKLALNVCIDSHYYRLHLTTHTKPNPQVAPNFCMLLRKYLTGSKIKSVTTNDLERIVVFELEAYDDGLNLGIKKLIVELMGKHSNVILVDNKNIIIDSLRHTDTEANSYRDVYPHKQYVFPRTEKKSFIEVKNFDMFYNSIGKNLTAKAVADSFVGISQAFVKHIICKFNITDDAEKMYNEMKSIVNSEEYVFEKTLDNNDFVVTAGKESTQFSVNFSIDDFYYEKESKEEYTAHKANMLRKIDVALKKYNKRLFNIDEKLKECENMDTYRLYGELITANLYKINDQHLESISLPNYYKNNEQEEVPLDKRYSTNVNAKRYFKKYSKLKNALKVLDGQKADTLSELDYIESVKYEIETAKDLDELKEIATEISESVVFKEKAGKNNKKKKAKDNNKNVFKPLKYEIGGFAVYVGRNNKENDWLTTKFAVNSDIWFHTKDIHGSHVILKTNGKNVVVDDNTLVECARLAAKHSKASTSANVPVDYCYVQFVKKPRCANPGMVIYTNNKTLYVNP